MSFVDVTVPTLPVIAFSTRKGETVEKFSFFSVKCLMIKKVSKVEECCPLKGGFLEGPMQSLKCDSGSDGTAHHGAQQGKQTNQTVRIPAELIHRGPTVHHPSNGSPRTANTWEYIVVHDKHEANRTATASHGELPRLPSREGRKKQKLKREAKLERRSDTRVPRGRDATRGEDIANAVQKCLEDNGIDIHKIASIATDGAR
ncbi:hypothetical protein AVEN_69046-1, partial [Araneus ventricosus]